MTRLKTDGAKENVDKVVSLFDGQVSIRGDIKSEYRAMLAGERSRVDLLVAETKIFDPVVASEDKILGALDAVGKRLDGHDALFTSSSLASETRVKGLEEIR